MKFYKPNFWNNNKFTIWPYVLFPFSLLIHLINYLKFTFSKKKSFDIPIICVGNIYLGGTGKTPLCIEIFNILKSLNVNPAFVRKYYEKFSDEQKLLEKKGKVFLNNQRAVAIKSLIDDNFDIALLDDGFQDPSIKSDMSIVCFNQKQWIGNGFVIPSGPLREKLTALKRCDYVFINGYKNEEMEKIINKFNPKIKIFYTEYRLIDLDRIKNKKFLAFAGIGNPSNFFDLLKKNNIEIIKTKSFPDHYNFTKKDILKLNQEANELNANLITTEKDFSRLKIDDKKNINYLKIELVFNNKDEFVSDLKKVI
tara:strand:- start:3 stop:932 length:930 start_codon:yes stop_codon:yes gene_type:complete